MNLYLSIRIICIASTSKNCTIFLISLSGQPVFWQINNRCISNDWPSFLGHASFCTVVCQGCTLTPMFPVRCSISRTVASFRAFMLIIVPLTTAMLSGERGRCLNAIVTLYCCCRRVMTGDVWSSCRCNSPVRGMSNIKVMGNNSYK